MDENEITQRLRDAGDRPIPGEVRASHLTRMHAATPVAEGPTRFGRFAVAAAAFVGFAVGSTGFAMAGALPDPAQRVAHDVLSVVQVSVEDPKQNHGRCVSEAMKGMDPAASDEARKAAKDAACPKAKGKPEGVGNGKPDHAGQGKGRPAHAGTPGGPKGARPEWGECQGPPAWAGKKTAEEKQAAKAQRAACREADVDADEQQAPDLEAPGEAEVRDDQAPGAEQRQADPGGRAPVETPPGPPAEGAPGQQDGGTAPPVEVPSPDEPTTDDAG